MADQSWHYMLIFAKRIFILSVMANLLTRMLREEFIDQNNIEVPYDSSRFCKWLVESGGMTEDEAHSLIERIILYDLEWVPGDWDLFKSISDLALKSEKSTGDLRRFYNDFILIEVDTYIEMMEERRELIKNESMMQFNEIIAAYRLFLEFQLATREHSSDWNDYCADEEDDDESEGEFSKRYDPIPLDKEFKRYLSDRRYKRGTCDKMLSNIRQFNTLVINNGRGESNWLESMERRASEGKNIKSLRWEAYKLCQHAILYSDCFNMSVAALRGAQTALIAYVEFLIDRQSKQKGIPD